MTYEGMQIVLSLYFGNHKSSGSKDIAFCKSIDVIVQEILSHMWIIADHSTFKLQLVSDRVVLDSIVISQHSA